MASCGEGTSSDESYAKELDVAVKAVHMACSLCQRVQRRLILAAAVSGDHVLSKDDDSPVTVAGTLYPQRQIWFRETEECQMEIDVKVEFFISDFLLLNFYCLLAKLKLKQN